MKVSSVRSNSKKHRNIENFFRNSCLIRFGSVSEEISRVSLYLNV